MKPFDLKEIFSAIGYVFRDSQILEQVFTHDSYANEHHVPSYQRLEFLGDSIVNFVTAKELFHRHPEAGEGLLSKMRAMVVSTAALSKATERMGLIVYLRTTSGAIEEEIMNSESVKADLFEAITGGVYLDGGIEEAEKFILRQLGAELEREYTAKDVTDYKSRLLEAAAKSGMPRPEFRVKKVDNLFSAVVYMKGRPYGTGMSGNKKGAEQEAAKEAFLANFQN